MSARRASSACSVAMKSGVPITAPSPVRHALIIGFVPGPEFQALVEPGQAHVEDLDRAAAEGEL